MSDEKEFVIAISSNGNIVYSLPDFNKGQFDAVASNLKRNLSYLGVTAWIEEYNPEKHDANP